MAQLEVHKRLIWMHVWISIHMHASAKCLLRGPGHSYSYSHHFLSLYACIFIPTFFVILVLGFLWYMHSTDVVCSTQTMPAVVFVVQKT